ncbi:formate/nitrite transporter family protein [Natronomonas salina]|nr:formate/nitrite transporter family protein [Natronomonas salina]QLD90053.1 formate/nitrite transporter family protein [Natronomonas salina]
MADDSPDEVETVRDAVERSRSGAPAAGEVVRDRFESDEIFQRIIAAADEEIDTGTRELFFSALAGGFAITITFLALASMTAKSDDPLLGVFLYPLGFVYIILGGYQLYTENTLPPVALVLERLASVPALLHTWVVVLVGNFAGGAFGALVLAYTGVFEPATVATAVELSEKGLHKGWWDLFFKGGFAGLIVAGVVWLDYAARDTITRFVLVYVAFLLIPLGDLFHVVVSFTELMYLVFLGEAALLPGLTGFVLPVLLGNTIGGVLLVTVVNYFQTTERRLADAREDGVERQLSVRELFGGGSVGRTYVPADKDYDRERRARRKED